MGGKLDSGQLESLAKILPDLPRWVEVRGLLLAGNCQVKENQSSLIVCSRLFPLVCVVGTPKSGDLQAVVNSSPETVEVVVAPEDAGRVGVVLKGWNSEAAWIHVQPEPQGPLPTTPEVGLLRPEELELVLGAPERLIQELHQAFEFSPIATSRIEGRPVSFCWAGSETEGLWDISIDTLEPYRRQGHATRAVAFLIELMRTRGKEPVWGALKSNLASLKLAEKLGFEPVDEVVVFTCHSGGD